MINLKKNDKLIIIIAVIIIIISGIGIAAYNPPEDEGKEKTVDIQNNYSVDWDVRSGFKTYSDFAGKSSPYEDTFSINIGNLKEIKFNLTWVDNIKFIFGFGSDTLILEVTTPDGEVYEESDKSGNIEIPIAVNSMPSSDIIVANDSSDAGEKLRNEPYFDDKWMNENFNIKISVKIGEIRILRKIRDKGNDFNLEVTYEYYSGTLTEIENDKTGDIEETSKYLTEEDYTPPYLSMIIGTGCGRYI